MSTDVQGERAPNAARTPAGSRLPPENFITASGEVMQEIYTPTDLAQREVDYARDLGVARRVSLHARRPRDEVPRQALDDAHVRRLRHCRGDQRALQVPARQRQPGLSVAFDMPTLYGLRHRRSQGRRRVRHLRRGGLVAGRHGDPVRRHPARRGHHLDDDQQPGGDDLGDVPRVGGKARHAAGTSFAARCRTTSSRSTSPRRSTSSRRGPRCGWSSTPSSSAREHVPRWNTISISGYHIREAGATAVAGAGLHAGRRHRVRASAACGAAWTSTTLRRACRSSSTSTTTSSRKSPSCARRAASGRG